MSTIYTFKDMRDSCSHFRRVENKAADPLSRFVPVCIHPENRTPGADWGFCDENVCPVLRAILDDGEEWE